MLLFDSSKLHGCFKCIYGYPENDIDFNYDIFGKGNCLGGASDQIHRVSFCLFRFQNISLESKCKFMFQISRTFANTNIL